MSGDEGVLHFSCDSCGIHLGVDDSLAGTKAPCPKCGHLVLAPEVFEEESFVPQSGVVRGVTGGGSFRIESGGRARESGSQERKVYPTSGRLAEEDERANFGVLLKIIGATFLVGLVVFIVVWYLQRK